MHDSVSTWDLSDKDTKMDAGDPPYTQLHHLNPHDDDGSDCDIEAKDDDDYEERLVVMMISDWKKCQFNYWGAGSQSKSDWEGWEVADQWS